MDRKYDGFPAKKKFDITLLVGKVMGTFFWTIKALFVSNTCQRTLT